MTEPDGLDHCEWGSPFGGCTSDAVMLATKSNGTTQRFCLFHGAHVQAHSVADQPDPSEFRALTMDDIYAMENP